MMKLRSSAIAVVALAGLLLAGCATLGPAYMPEQAVSADQATVYIYRDSKFVGGGVSYTVNGNGAPLAKLSSGSYFVYHALPGEVEFTAQTEAKTSVTVDVKAGEVYYVKGTVGWGVFVGHPHLMLVTREVGEKEIVSCKLAPGSASDPTVAAADQKQ
jgi:predicted small lipoprotein YifL